MLTEEELQSNLLQAAKDVLLWLSNGAAWIHDPNTGYHTPAGNDFTKLQTAVWRIDGKPVYPRQKMLWSETELNEPQ